MQVIWHARLARPALETQPGKPLHAAAPNDIASAKIGYVQYRAYLNFSPVFRRTS